MDYHGFVDGVKTISSMEEVKTKEYCRGVDGRIGLAHSRIGKAKN